MAKSLQIFVFALALAQGYCAVAQISTFPAFVERVPPILLPPVIAEELPPVGAEVEPLPLPTPPEVPEQPAAPPCVTVVKSILQAIIDRLENISGAVTLPEIVESPSVPVTPEHPEVPQLPEAPEVPVVNANPCSACFEYISSLLATAQRLATLKALTKL